MKEKDALSRAFAADEPGLPDRAVSLRQLRIPHHYLPHRADRSSGSVSRAARAAIRIACSSTITQPIAGGRELWGFPKKLANPILRAEIDTLVGELHYGQIRVAVGTMGYKHKQADLAAIGASLAAPNYLLKIIPTSTGHRAFANWSNIT
jgi:Acetoacetate decarboxylase (ADC)